MYVSLEPVIVTLVVPSIAPSEPVPQNLEPPPVVYPNAVNIVVMSWKALAPAPSVP